MCRALLYLGEPVLLDNLLFQPDSALVRQSYMPKMLHMLNLAGFGMRAWDPESHDPQRPFSYASDALPVFDRNLKNLAAKVAAGCVLAHVRGVAYNTQVEISLQNVHPFQFPGVPLTLAHNGDLARFAELRPRLPPTCAPSSRATSAGRPTANGSMRWWSRSSPTRTRRRRVPRWWRPSRARSPSSARSAPRSASTSHPR